MPVELSAAELVRKMPAMVRSRKEVHVVCVCVCVCVCELVVLWQAFL